MQTLRIATVPGVLAIFALSSVLGACGGPSKDTTTKGKAGGKTPAGAADGKAADGKAAETPTPAADGAAPGSSSAAAGGDDPAGAGSTGAAAKGTGDGSGTAAATGPAGTGAAPADADGSGTSGPAAAGSSSGGGVDTAALLKELKSRRTKDARITEVVALAEEAGVEGKAIAKALNLRGQALHASPDRAKVMFELASEKDPKNPLPAFNLAKQAAVLGELADAKTWLKVVHERKGRKLLQQIDFDPMWEILKDDPEVRALIK